MLRRHFITPREMAWPPLEPELVQLSYSSTLFCAFIYPTNLMENGLRHACGPVHTIQFRYIYLLTQFLFRVTQPLDVFGTEGDNLTFTLKLPDEFAFTTSLFKYENLTKVATVSRTNG